MFLLQKKKWQFCEVMKVLANLIVVIDFGVYIVLNHHTVQLKLTQCYISIISHKAEKNKIN